MTEDIKGALVRIEGKQLQQHCSQRAAHHMEMANKAYETFKEAKAFFDKNRPPERAKKDFSKFSGNTYGRRDEEDPLEEWRDDVIKTEKRAAYFAMWGRNCITDARYTLTVLEADDLELASIHRRHFELDT